MAVGSVVMWIGVPLGLIYLASQIATPRGRRVGPYLLVLIGLPIGMAIVGKCLGTSIALHGGSRAVQEGRPPRDLAALDARRARPRPAAAACSTRS